MGPAFESQPEYNFLDMRDCEIISLMESAEKGWQWLITPFDVLHDRQPLTIKEGLIATYPTERVIKSLSGNFNLTVNGGKGSLGGLWKLKGLEEPSPVGDIRVVKPNGEEEIILLTLPKDSKFQESIDKLLLKYGWFNSRTDEDGSSLKYYYEKKFGDRFSVRQLRNMTDFVYHTTSSRVKEKILKQGLVPKESRTPGFNNEPRIFFRPDVPTFEDAEAICRMKGDYAAPVVLEVDLSKLNQFQSFFFDSRWRNSIYTFEPIPPEAIRVMKTSELPKMKLF